MAQTVKDLPVMEIFPSLGGEDPLEKEQLPTPVFLPGEFYGQGAWCVTVHGVIRNG